jgi:3D (Asp-Asp-Asp) domain-containing protein
MRTLTLRALPLALCILAAGCSSPRPLPPYEKPIARTQFQRVRTTAYTDTESDHIQYTNHNALGTCLQSGAIHSAAADWSRWPAGTLFRVIETGEVYQVDDYGWALAGTNTIDLYKPSRELMNAWGVRHVTIENLQWGDPGRSLAVLRPRARYRHIQRMVGELRERYAELSRPVPTSSAPIMGGSTDRRRPSRGRATHDLRPGGPASFHSAPCQRCGARSVLCEHRAVRMPVALNISLLSPLIEN